LNPPVYITDVYHFAIALAQWRSVPEAAEQLRSVGGISRSGRQTFEYILVIPDSS
jgi:fructose-bisphosphate aldolase class 1